MERNQFTIDRKVEVTYFRVSNKRLGRVSVFLASTFMRCESKVDFLNSDKSCIGSFKWNFNPHDFISYPVIGGLSNQQLFAT